MKEKIDQRETKLGAGRPNSYDGMRKELKISVDKSISRCILRNNSIGVNIMLVVDISISERDVCVLVWRHKIMQDMVYTLASCSVLDT